MHPFNRPSAPLQLPSQQPYPSVSDIESARQTFSKFKHAFKEPLVSMCGFAIRISDKSDTKSSSVISNSIWIYDSDVLHDMAFGNSVRSTNHCDSQCRISETDIVDWMFIQNCRLMGGYSLRTYISSDHGKDYDYLQWFDICDDTRSESILSVFFDAIGDHDNQKVIELATRESLLNEPGEVCWSGIGRHISRAVMLPTFYALGCHNDMVAIELLQLGASPTLSLKTCNSALVAAAANGRQQYLAMALKSGADPNSISAPLRATALFAAAGNCMAGSVKILLQHGADVNFTSIKGEKDWQTWNVTPMHLASTVEIASLLHIAGAKPNLQRSDGRTALHSAIFNELNDVAAYLIKSGYSLSIQDANGMTPLDYAKENGLYAVLRNI